jgi:diaminopimelate epimerase
VSEQGIPYVKASGCGNVFLLVGQEHASAEKRSSLSLRMCKEFGADGVEWIAPSPDADADVDAVLINADGSQAEISGNGTRCVAAQWALSHSTDMIRVRTGAGVRQCKLRARDGNDFEFETNLGEPTLEGIMEMFLPVGKLKGMKLSMGNPQFVVFVEGFDFDWKKRGAEIQAKKVFAHGVNVSFVKVLRSSEIEARFFERGVGATQSSGTGSCAAAVAAIAADFVVSPVRVRSEGGLQIVTWEQQEVVLRGPASIEESGEFAA